MQQVWQICCQQTTPNAQNQIHCAPQGGLHSHTSSQLFTCAITRHGIPWSLCVLFYRLKRGRLSPHIAAYVSCPLLKVQPLPSNMQMLVLDAILPDACNKLCLNESQPLGSPFSQLHVYSEQALLVFSTTYHIFTTWLHY